MGTGNCSRPDISEEILLVATSLHNGGSKISMAWIPAHIGIAGNQKADDQANKGRSSQSKIETGLGVSKVKGKVREIINKQWSEEWQSSTNGRSAYPLFQKPSRKSHLQENLKIPINRKVLKLY